MYIYKLTQPVAKLEALFGEPNAPHHISEFSLAFGSHSKRDDETLASTIRKHIRCGNAMHDGIR